MRVKLAAAFILLLLLVRPAYATIALPVWTCDRIEVSISSDQGSPYVPGGFPYVWVTVATPHHVATYRFQAWRVADVDGWHRYAVTGWNDVVGLDYYTLWAIDMPDEPFTTVGGVPYILCGAHEFVYLPIIER